MRIIVITLAYNSREMMRASLDRFRDTFGIPYNRFEHHFVDQCWPKGGSAEFLQEQLSRGNTIVHRPGKNLGLHNGFNLALREAKIRPEDIVIGFDPDCFPETNGWGYAMERVLKADPSIGWVSCWNAHTSREFSERGDAGSFEAGGVPVKIARLPMLNSVCAWRGSYLLKAGGIHERNPLYGGLECDMWSSLAKTSMKWAFMPDYLEGSAPEELVDLDYREWKWVTTHGGQKQIDFSEWLQNRR